MNILIIGIKGNLAQLTARLISQIYSNANIIGVDSRKLKPIDNISNLQTFIMPYTIGGFEFLFRNYNFDLVYQIGTLEEGHYSANAKMRDSLELRKLESTHILDFCSSYKVKKVVVLSSHSVYGALPDNPVNIKEDAPLNGDRDDPFISYQINRDNKCSTWMWRHKSKVSVVILRPCNIIGPQIKNSMTMYLKKDFLPYPIDFNPTLQFIHEYDMARVISFAGESLDAGIYNVANFDFITLKKALSFTNKIKLPLPFFTIRKLKFLKNNDSLSFPPYMLDHLSYPCLVDANKLQRVLPEDFFKFSVEETLSSINN